MKEFFYTLFVWFLKKKINEALERELPAPNNNARPKIALIPGHTKKQPGAIGFFKVNRSGGVEINEYQYTNEIVDLMVSLNKFPFDLVRITRDNIGISGAYEEAEKQKCDAVIELHFNSFEDSAVTGSETLCTFDKQDKEFALKIHQANLETFSLKDKGIKTIARLDRGGINVYSFPNGRNCILEPFFASNENDLRVGVTLKKTYALNILKQINDFYFGS